MNFNAYGFGPPDDAAMDRRGLRRDVRARDRHAGRRPHHARHPLSGGAARGCAGHRATHAHEDHIGAIAPSLAVLRCPIYATPFTARLIEGKLEEAGLRERVRVKDVPLGGSITLGPFAIDFISITHSIPEPNALAIRTPLGVVVHTGDWKIDPDPLLGEATDAARAAEAGRRGRAGDGLRFHQCAGAGQSGLGSARCAKA